MRFVLRALGWGIVIYAVMYLLWSGLVVYGLSANIYSLVFRVLALVVVTACAARALNLVTRMDVLPYSIGWAIVATVLDAVFLVPFAGWGLYMKWSVWAGYALVVIAPVLTFRFPRLRTPVSAEVRQPLRV